MTTPDDLPSARRNGPAPRRRLLVLTLLLVPASAWALTSCKPKTNAYAPPPPSEVTVAHPIRRPVTRYLAFTGTTEAYATVELRARVPGFLDQCNFKPGAVVKKGDLLFVIDRRTFQATTQKAGADLHAAEARLKEAQFAYQRLEGLRKQNVAAEQEFVQATAALGNAQAAIEASTAALDSAKLDLDFCEVRAPIDGRITKNFVDVGNLVGAAGPPTVLAELVNSRPIYVSVDVSESDYLAARRARMAKHQHPDTEPEQFAPGERRPVDVATGDSDEFNVHGYVDYADPALNPQSGTIRVRCRFENENEFLVPGLFVRLRILLDTSDAMVVPDIALLSDQSGRYALIVNDKDVVEVRRVKIGTLDGPMRVVLSGLGATDRVIVNDLQRANPGLTVKPTLKELGPPGNTAPAGPDSQPSESAGGPHV